MKIPFSLPKDGKRHRYCQNCYSEKVKDVIVKGKRLYYCNRCKQAYDRLIDLNPNRVWWVDNKTKEYWHESVGVIVSRPDKKILLFERTIYPYGFTLPAGHLDIKENPKKAAARELFEETGIKSSELKLLTEEDLKGDLCRGGADCHRWHLFTLQLIKKEKLSVNPEEGVNPVWLTTKEALLKRLTSPTRHFLEKYRIFVKRINVAPILPTQLPKNLSFRRV